MTFWKKVKILKSVFGKGEAGKMKANTGKGKGKMQADQGKGKGKMKADTGKGKGEAPKL
jgi:hypothetical protein